MTTMRSIVLHTIAGSDPDSRSVGRPVTRHGAASFQDLMRPTLRASTASNS